MNASQSEHFDVVVVGARCAGATLATLLARKSARVLLVDQARLPSDLVLSTHTLHPAGARVLERLGLLDALRQVTPGIGHVRLERGTGRIDLQMSEKDYEYCPRRQRFDHLLQQAAREAGAELRDQTRATGLLQDGTRVVGVRLLDARGLHYDVRAERVIGADGRDSKVASWVNAEQYLDYVPERCMYWSYWPAPRGYGQSAELPGMFVSNRVGMVHIAFHTDHDQVLVGCLPERSGVARYKAQPLTALRAALSSNPMLHSLVQAEPCESVRGFIPQRYFFRRAAGEGWALLGDAGVHKEFITGDGMSEALLQACSLASALEGDRAALERWWLERDVAAMPMYFFGKLQGAAGAPPAIDSVVLGRAATDPELCARFVQTLTHELSPFDAVPTRRVLGWLLRELLRGRFGLLRDLAVRARWMQEFRGATMERLTRLERLNAQNSRKLGGARATISVEPVQSLPMSQ